MVGTRKVGPGGGFGARYGTVARRRYMEIITEMRRRHECPRCNFRSVRRLSVGIWRCRKCGLKFAGGAYTPMTKLGEIAYRAAKGVAVPGVIVEELGIAKKSAEVAELVGESKSKEVIKEKPSLHGGRKKKAAVETSLGKPK